MSMFDWIIPLASFVVAAVGGFLLRRSGRKAEQADNAAKVAHAERKTHDRLNRAPTGDDVPADDLPDRLRAIADDFRSKRK